MQEENKKQIEQSTLSDNQINNIIFGTLYKRKISIKDWLYTKYGFTMFLFISYLFFTNELSGEMIAFVSAVSLFLYNKETTLAHEKESLVWLIKYKKFFFNRLEEVYSNSLKKQSAFKEAEQILEMCNKKNFKPSGRKKIKKKASR